MQIPAFSASCSSVSTYSEVQKTETHWKPGIMFSSKIQNFLKCYYRIVKLKKKKKKYRNIFHTLNISLLH